MTSSTRLHRRCAMLFKWAMLLCALLIAPGAWAENCRLSLSQAHIDYGAIRRAGPVTGASMALPTRSLHLTVLCAEPSAMALRFTGAAADGQGFQFGRPGRFRLSLKHARVDGRAVEWAAMQRPDESTDGQLLPGQTLEVRVAGMRVAGRRLTAQVDIDTDLPADALEVRNEARLEGRGSLELISLPAPPSQ